MPGVAGEWFRPFALTVVASVLVSLFISFTLDPMLSAFWGDPPGHHHAPRRGLSRLLARFNAWFDRKADGYGRVIAWALHHRVWMALFAVASFCGAIALQLTVGGSSFLPASDFGTIAIDVRTPSSASLEYARRKIESAAALARTLPETKATNSYVNAGGGRIYVDIGKSTHRKRSALQIAAQLRTLVARLVGAEYTVLDDLNNGAQKPVQIRFSGPDSRRLTAITNVFMEKLRQVPGAVDVGLSELEPQDELKIELDRGLANALGISVNDAAQALRVAFAGVEVGDWIDPTGETRDVAVRLHPRRPRRCEQHRAPAHCGGWHRHGGAAGPDRHRHPGQGTVPDPARRRQADDLGVGQRAGPLGRRGDRRCAEDRQGDELPARLRARAGGSIERPAGGLHADGHCPGDGRGPDVPDPRDAVRLLHGAAAGHDVAAAQPDRRRAGALADRRHDEPHEPDRRHHAGRPGGQERDPPARRRPCARGRRHGLARRR